MPWYVWHRDRARSFERDITWVRPYIPSRLPTILIGTREGKELRRKPPSGKPKKR